MIRKIVGLFLILVMIFSMLVPASANNDMVINKAEIKKAHAKVKELALNKNLDKLDQLEDVKRISSALEKNPLMKQKYLESLDALDPNKIQEKFEGFSISNNEETIIEFDDGSFVIIGLETKLVEGENDSTFSMLSTTYYEELSGYGNWETKYWIYIVGLYPVARLQLNTEYTHYTGHFTINHVNTTGSWAIMPATLDNATASIVSNNAANVRSRGDYRLTEYVSGVPVRTYTRALTLDIQKISGPNFSVTGLFHL